MTTLVEIAEEYRKMAKHKFSKATLIAHIGKLMDDQEYLFKQAEGKPYDSNNGTSQCSTIEGHAAHAVYIAFENLIEDVEIGEMKR